MPGDRIAGVCFLWVTFLCTSTAPQERREQRSWPRSGEGQATAWMPEVEQRRSSCRMP